MGEEELGVEARRAKNGRMAVFATRSFKKGEVVHWLNGEHVDAPTRTSIEVGVGAYVEDEIGRFVNHSFSPTTEVAGICLVAVRDIEIGDEITFNYVENESKISHPFECSQTGRQVRK